MVMVAVGTTAPLGSVTVPKTVAVWAKAATLEKATKTKTRQGFCIPLSCDPLQTGLFRRIPQTTSAYNVKIPVKITGYSIICHQSGAGL
jgi:hypothetical protein